MLSSSDSDVRIAEREARTDAAWMTAHGYETSVHRFSTALNCYGPSSRRTVYAAGFAVRYSGTLIRDDGSRAEYPTEGIKVYCQDGQLPLARVLQAGRALVTFSGYYAEDDGHGTYGPYEPYFAAGWNPRDTELRCDQSVNPGTLQYVLLHELTPMAPGDGPMRFFDLRMIPAGDLATGDRVRVVSGDFAGQAGAIAHSSEDRPVVDLDPQPDPVLGITRSYGQLRQFQRAELEPEPDTDRDDLADAAALSRIESSACDH